MEKSKLISKKIIVKSHQISKDEKNSPPKWTRIDIIDTNNDRYSFFTKKIDGTPTKAATFYKENMKKWSDNDFNGVANEVYISYEEKQNTYTRKDGKMGTSTNRTIRIMSEDEFKKDPAYKGMVSVEDVMKNSEIPTIDINEEEDEPDTSNIQF
jgi:hypothetical protein